jgi:hypothetical protein
VDAVSFGPKADERLPVDTGALVLRLQRAGVPVAVLRHGDNLAAVLGAGELRAVG